MINSKVTVEDESRLESFSEEELADDELSGAEENGDEDENENAASGSQGWANVMASILNKKTDKNVILAKALSEKELSKKRKLKEREEKDEDGEAEEDRYMSRAERESFIERKRQWENMGRIKPDVTHKDREKALQRIATRGIVQLFNAVKKQQKTISEKLQSHGRSEMKKEKVLKSMSKGDFLDMLKGPSSNLTSQPVPESKRSKKDNKTDAESDEDKPKWGILRDTFMMGAKMKDWDKDEDETDDSDRDNNDEDDDDGSDAD